MKNQAIINAAKIAIKRVHTPKSIRGKIKVTVDDDGIKVMKIIKKK